MYQSLTLEANDQTRQALAEYINPGGVRKCGSWLYMAVAIGAFRSFNLLPVNVKRCSYDLVWSVQTQGSSKLAVFTPSQCLFVLCD